MGQTYINVDRQSREEVGMDMLASGEGEKGKMEVSR